MVAVLHERINGQPLREALNVQRANFDSLKPPERKAFIRAAAGVKQNSPFYRALCSGESRTNATGKLAHEPAVDELAPVTSGGGIARGHATDEFAHTAAAGETYLRTIIALEHSWGWAVDTGFEIPKAIAVECARRLGGDAFASLVEVSTARESEFPSAVELMPEYHKVVKAVPPSLLTASPKLKELVALAFNARARAIYDCGHYGWAILELNKALKLALHGPPFPDLSNAESTFALYAHKAQIQINLADYEGAMMSIEKAFEKDPDGKIAEPHIFAFAHYLKANIIAALGFPPEDSLLEFDAALKADPNYPEALVMRACTNCRIADNAQGPHDVELLLEGAMRDAEKALELDPENKQAQRLKEGLRKYSELPQDTRGSPLNIIVHALSDVFQELLPYLEPPSLELGSN
ncbi:MAG: hypothetical protein Q7T16_00720 [Candidatus Burarchaeum sp.]|nr:hypothetical protein [Candidatus Burarchaeum sp.]MDO8339159.1 hypothetical protein [Candidatus Burarchaeum sp.]